MPLTPQEKRRREDKIDRQMKDTFPAPDPPSYAGGKHIIGAPKERKSRPAKPHDHAVKEAEEKVKSGDATTPETY